MLLFRPEHVAPILDGRKTQTRRLGKRRWNVGAIHKCYTKPPFARGGSKPFASVCILEVLQEPLRSISHDDAEAEGYTGIGTFLYAFYAINWMASNANPLVWVVTFENVEYGPPIEMLLQLREGET
jgi:hypothetical protein